VVDTNNINITVSLSDDTLEKLAAIFSQAVTPYKNEKLAWDPNHPGAKVIEKPVSREVVVEQEPVQAQETGVDLDEGQCGLVFDDPATGETRKSKAKRIDNKKNHRIGEDYWCRKPQDHTGKHVEGFMPKAFQNVEAPAQDAEPVEPVEPAEPTEQSDGLERLDGYENDSKCGWWQDGNKAKFCELEPEHSMGRFMPNNNHVWQNPAPVMQVSAIWSPKERVWRSGE
jgi:hypothetical protein